MALSGSRLTGTSTAAALAELQSLFPPPAGLLSGELAAYNSAQENIAMVVGAGVGDPVVTEIESNAVVTVTAVTPGSGTAPGTIA